MHCWPTVPSTRLDNVKQGTRIASCDVKCSPEQGALRGQAGRFQRVLQVLHGLTSLQGASTQAECALSCVLSVCSKSSLPNPRIAGMPVLPTKQGQVRCPAQLSCYKCGCMHRKQTWTTLQAGTHMSPGTLIPLVKQGCRFWPTHCSEQHATPLRAVLGTHLGRRTSGASNRDRQATACFAKLTHTLSKQECMYWHASTRVSTCRDSHFMSGKCEATLMSLRSAAFPPDPELPPPRQGWLVPAGGGGAPLQPAFAVPRSSPGVLSHMTP